MPRLRPVLLAAIALLAASLAVAGFWPSGVRARAALDRAQALHDLRQVAHALALYEKANGSLPASAAFLGPGGKPLLSWRVAVLPSLECEALYAQFRPDEPFDSAHNLGVLDGNPMPRAFEVSGAPAPPRHTRVVGFAADGTQRKALLPAFNLTATGLKPGDFPDGPFNTAQLVLAETPVVWTAPSDLPFTPGGDHKLLLHFPVNWGRTTAVATADGKSRLLPAEVLTAQVQALLTRNGHD